MLNPENFYTYSVRELTPVDFGQSPEWLNASQHVLNDDMALWYLASGPNILAIERVKKGNMYNYRLQFDLGLRPSLAFRLEVRPKEGGGYIKVPIYVSQSNCGDRIWNNGKGSTWPR